MLGTKNMKNRSRSVIIRLQVPRHSPTVHRKLLSGERYHYYIIKHIDYHVNLYKITLYGYKVDFL